LATAAISAGDDGIYEQYFKKLLLTKGEVKNGLKNGKWSFYYPNQSLHFEGSFADDQKNGKWIYFNDKGVKSTEVLYKNNALDSVAIFYNNAGAKIAQEHFDNGKFTGFTEFFDHNGIISATLITEKHKTTFETFHPNGQLRFLTVNWLNKKNDTTKVYHANGQVKEVLSFYKNILLAVGESYNEDGKEVHNGDFENGKGSVIRYFDNNKISSIANYEAGLKNGIAQFYYSNGKLKEAGMFAKGRKIGVWKYYNEKGELLESKEHRAEEEDMEFHNDFSLVGLDLNKFASVPMFPGGERAFNKFAKENIAAFDYLKNEHAIVLIRLDDLGFVENIEVRSEKLSEEICNGIAKSLANMPRCLPAFQDGISVASTLTQYIEF